MKEVKSFLFYITFEDVLKKRQILLPDFKTIKITSSEVK